MPSRRFIHPTQNVVRCRNCGTRIFFLNKDGKDLAFLDHDGELEVHSCPRRQHLPPRFMPAEHSLDPPYECKMCGQQVWKLPVRAASPLDDPFFEVVLEDGRHAPHRCQDMFGFSDHPIVERYSSDHALAVIHCLKLLPFDGVQQMLISILRHDAKVAMVGRFQTTERVSKEMAPLAGDLVLVGTQNLGSLVTRSRIACTHWQRVEEEASKVIQNLYLCDLYGAEPCEVIDLGNDRFRLA